MIARTYPGLICALILCLSGWPATPTSHGQTTVVPTATQRLVSLRAQLENRDFRGLAEATTQTLPESTGWSAAERATLLELAVESRWQSLGYVTDETLALAEESLALREATAAPDSLNLVPSLRNLGMSHELRGDFDAALDNYDRALQLVQRSDPGTTQHGVVLRHLANALRIVSDLEGAEATFNEALALQPPGHPERVFSLIQRSRLNLAMGEFEEAATDAREALVIADAMAQSQVPADVGLRGQAAAAVALVLDQTGQLDAARSEFGRAIADLEAAYGQQHIFVAYTQNTYGVHLQGRGDLPAARLALETALSIMQTWLPPGHIYVVAISNNLAELLAAEGDFESARRILTRLVANIQVAVGEIHPYTAAFLSNLAGNHYDTYDFETALPMYERARTIYEQLVGSDHYMVGETDTSMATVLRALGRLDEAEAAFQRGLKILEEQFGEVSDEVAYTLTAMGELYVARNELDTAQATVERALTIAREALGEDHVYVGWNLQNLGRLAAQRGQLETARGFLEQALGSLESSVGANHPDSGEVLADLARLHDEMGQGEQAVDYAIRTEHVAREHLRLLARGASERNALFYAQNRSSGLDIAARWAGRSDSPATIQIVWDSVIRSRGLVFDEMAERRRAARINSDAETESLLQRLRSARTELASANVRGPDGAGTEEFREELTELTLAKERAEEELAERSLRFRDKQRSDQAGFDAVAGALPKAATLVAYINVRDNAGADRYAAFVMAPEQPLRMVDLGPATVIDRAIESWRREIRAGATAGGPFARNAEARTRQAGTTLRQLVWDPLLDSADGASLIFVVPEGSLHHVNFAALPGDGGTYLVETTAPFVVLSSEKDLIPNSSDANTGGLLAVGGPDFGEFPTSNQRGIDRDCIGLSELSFAPLAATAEEARAVQSKWQSLRDEASTLRVGAGAKEGVVKRMAPGRRVLHFATHGFFLGQTCDVAPSASRTSTNWAVRSHVQPRGSALTNPLLASGLAFASANERSTTASPGSAFDDGILSSEEIVALDLDGTEWVVLSACDTGLGKRVRSEGVLGLRRSFQLSGARSLISSLWSVDDDATRAWMESLYDLRLSTGRSTASAVHEASLAMLRARRSDGRTTHPYFWGAFVAAGDWR